MLELSGDDLPLLTRHVPVAGRQSLLVQRAVPNPVYEVDEVSYN